MGNRYDGTTLIPPDGGTPEDQNKAFLDLLGKMNEISSDLASLTALVNRNGLGVIETGGDAFSSWDLYKTGRLVERGWGYVLSNGGTTTLTTIAFSKAFKAGTMPNLLIFLSGYKNNVNPTSRIDRDGTATNQWAAGGLTIATPHLSFAAGFASASAQGNTYRFLFEWQATGEA